MSGDHRKAVQGLCILAGLGLLAYGASLLWGTIGVCMVVGAFLLWLGLKG